ncbi:MAG: hypothetical protein AB1689_16215 [Thermodesulfobacteriota bacterium]
MPRTTPPRTCHPRRTPDLRRVSAAVALLALGAAAACQRGPAETPWFPLAGGRTWTYLVSTEPGEGEEPAVLQVETMGPETVGEQRVVRQRIELGGETYFRFMAADGRGVYRYATQSAGEQSPSLDPTRDDLLVLPPEQGRSWRGEASFSFVDGPEKVPIESVVESTSETVDVPAGRFPGCVKVRVSGQARGDRDRSFTLSEQVWYATGVGMVKSVVEEREAGPTPRTARVTTELAAYAQ